MLPHRLLLCLRHHLLLHVQLVCLLSQLLVRHLLLLHLILGHHLLPLHLLHLGHQLVMQGQRQQQQRGAPLLLVRVGVAGLGGE